MTAKNNQAVGNGISTFSDDKAFGLRHLLLGAILALIFTTTFVPSASALQVSVVNEQGTAQSGAFISSSLGYGTVTTDSSGIANVSWAGPGDTLLVSRDTPGTCEQAPSWTKSVPLTAPLPATEVITVPSMTLGSYEPQLSDRERGLIGLINQQRAAAGIAPLYISQVLDTVSDSYATVFPEYSEGLTADQAHCAAYGPGTRIKDSGFPVSGAGGPQLAENIAWSESATETFNGWMESAPHRESMLNPKFDAVGVADDGDKWIIDLAYVDPADPNYARAQMTSDTGDPALADTTPPATSLAPVKIWSGAGRDDLRNPRLKIRTSYHRVGKKFKVQVHAEVASDALAIGHLQLTVQKRLKGTSKTLITSAQSTMSFQTGAGKIIITAKFSGDGSGEWLTSVVSRPLKLQLKQHRHPVRKK